MRRLNLALTLCSSVGLFVGQSTAQGPTGVIRGTVVNEKAQPLPKAKVSADPLDNRIKMRPVRYVETDREGNFLIDRLEWGSYRVYAMKEEDGYPNTYWSFYSNAAPPTVTLSSTGPEATVLLGMGPKAGILRIVSVTDAVTGQNLANIAGVNLTRTSVPATFIGVAPSDHILVPSATDVTVDIQASGYAPWPPPDQPKLGQIRLGSDEVLDLRIELRPLSGLAAEVERMVRRAADANRLRMLRGKVAGPFPPPEKDIARLRELGDQALKALATYIEPGQSALAQGGVVSLLEHLGGNQSFDLVQRFALKADDASVRSRAVAALAASGRPEDSILLQTVAVNDPDAKVRAEAERLLQKH